MKPSELFQTKGFCQHRLAEDSRGISVSFESEEAVSFCIVGAIWRCYKDTGLLQKVLDSLAVRLVVDVDEGIVTKVNPNRVPGLVNFNNHPETTKEDIVEFLKRHGY